MMLAGKWTPEIKTRTRHKGFWINSLYSPWLTWSDIAAEFLKSKDYIELLMNFVNSWLAEVWEEKIEEHSDIYFEKCMKKLEKLILKKKNEDEEKIKNNNKNDVKNKKIKIKNI